MKRIKPQTPGYDIVQEELRLLARVSSTLTEMSTKHAGTPDYDAALVDLRDQLAEAKPEDMRAHLEEAAGISKYKERRRETENRIRHTRDNLDRLNDLREEVDNQLKHLER